MADTVVTADEPTSVIGETGPCAEDERSVVEDKYNSDETSVIESVVSTTGTIVPGVDTTESLTDSDGKWSAAVDKLDSDSDDTSVSESEVSTTGSVVDSTDSLTDTDLVGFTKVVKLVLVLFVVVKYSETDQIKENNIKGLCQLCEL